QALFISTDSAEVVVLEEATMVVEEGDAKWKSTYAFQSLFSTKKTFNLKGEEEVGVEQFPDFPERLVTYPPCSDAYREFCKAKASTGGRWGNCIYYAGRQFRGCTVATREEYFYLLADLEKKKKDRGLDESISFVYFDGNVWSELSEGFLCYLPQLEYGLSLPLSNLAKGIINLNGACPIQINGNMWEVISVCKALNLRWEGQGRKRRISTEDVLQFYGIYFFGTSGGAYFCISATQLCFFDLNSVGRTWNDNVIWVKGDCLQRDDKEPMELLFRTVKQRPKLQVERKESLIDKVPLKEIKLEAILEDLGIIRNKRVNGRVKLKLARLRDDKALQYNKEFAEELCRMREASKDREDQHVKVNLYARNAEVGERSQGKKNDGKISLVQGDVVSLSARIRELEGDTARIQGYIRKGVEHLWVCKKKLDAALTRERVLESIIRSKEIVIRDKVELFKKILDVNELKKEIETLHAQVAELEAANRAESVKADKKSAENTAFRDWVDKEIESQKSKHKEEVKRIELERDTLFDCMSKRECFCKVDIDRGDCTSSMGMDLGHRATKLIEEGRIVVTTRAREFMASRPPLIQKRRRVLGEDDAENVGEDMMVAEREEQALAVAVSMAKLCGDDPDEASRQMKRSMYQNNTLKQDFVAINDAFEKRLEGQHFNHEQVLRSKLVEKEKEKKEQRKRYQGQFDYKVLDNIEGTEACIIDGGVGGGVEALVVEGTVAGATTDVGSKPSTGGVDGVSTKEPVWGEDVAALK
ncbi:hypothetical protein GIB67_021091, partial [Kingdonia uniflora]